MPPRTKPIGRSLSQGTLQKICMSADQSTTQKRIYDQTDERYRFLSQDTDIIIADNLTTSGQCSQRSMQIHNHLPRQLRKR